MSNSPEFRQWLAYSELGGLLQAQQNHGLPTVAWWLTDTGGLVGLASERTVFEAWAAHLGATPTELAGSDGTIRLQAVFRRGGVDGVIRADLDPVGDRAPFRLTGHDRYRIGQAREALAAAEQTDAGDGQATARALGRLEVAVTHLLAVFDEHDGGEQQ